MLSQIQTELLIYITMVSPELSLDYCGLQSEYQDSQGYTENPCLERNKEKQTEEQTSTEGCL